MANFFATHRSKTEEDQNKDYILDLLHFLNLESFKDQKAVDLSFGIQKRVELARAMALDPKVLLLDEPAGGLNPQETENLMGLIQSIRDERGISILLVEHDMRLVMELSDRICVLHFWPEDRRRHANSNSTEQKCNRSLFGHNKTRCLN